MLMISVFATAAIALLLGFLLGFLHGEDRTQTQCYKSWRDNVKSYDPVTSACRHRRERELSQTDTRL